LFPVMDLDRMIDIFQIFFPESLNKGGYYVSTNDRRKRCNYAMINIIDGYTSIGYNTLERRRHVEGKGRRGAR